VKFYIYKGKNFIFISLDFKILKIFFNI
jgi:hypothetical protein